MFIKEIIIIEIKVTNILIKVKSTAIIILVIIRIIKLFLFISWWWFRERAGWRERREREEIYKTFFIEKNNIIYNKCDLD